MGHGALLTARPARRPRVLVPAVADPFLLALCTLEALGFVLLVSRSYVDYGGAAFGSFVIEWVYAALLLLPAVACGHRARRTAAPTTGIWLVAAAILSLCAGTVVFALVLDATGSPVGPPSPSDAFWLAALPLAYAGLVKIAPQRRGAGWGMWLDGLVGGLAIASIGAVTVFADLFSHIPDATAAVVTLAYPLGDVTLLALVGWLVLVGELRRGALLITLAFAVDAAADSAFAYHNAVGSFDPGSLVAISYVAAAVLLATGACRAAASAEAATEAIDEYRAVLPPALFAATGVGVLAWSLATDAAGPGPLLALIAVTGSCVRLLGVLRRAHALEALASEDVLTGLGNRRFYDTAVAQEIRHAERYGLTFSVALFDLDGFKLVNDTRGHAEGDSLLGSVGEILRTEKREGDAAYRVGGDEFALILPGTSRADASAAAHALALRMSALDPGVRASIGVAEWPADGTARRSLLEHADRSLYAAKPARDGAPVPVRTASDPPRGWPAPDSDVVGRILAVARAELRMDLAYLSHWEDGDQVLEVLDGDGASFAAAVGTRTPLGLTLCEQMVDGRIDGVIADVPGHSVVGALAVTRKVGVGAYVGVPVTRADGSVYGTLCCLSHAIRTDLTARDESFLRVLGGLLGDVLERAEALERQHLVESRATGIEALLAALGARDDYTAAHSRGVVRLSAAVARSLGLGAPEVVAIEQVALLHDIGKVGVSDLVLRKPGRLDPAERRLMREHAIIGYEIIAAIPMLAQLAPSIRAEHERWDGTGYPDGLAGAAIPLASRIVFACDSYDAMTTDRPYRRALPVEQAVAELRRCAGSQFDPHLVELLIAIVGPARGAA